VNFRLSDCAPALVGVNVTPTVQLELAVRLLPQVLDEIANWVPVCSAMLEIVMAAFPAVSVTLCAELVVLMDWMAKERLSGDKTATSPAGATVALPVMAVLPLSVA
jgi:hypothetical protein